LRKAKKDLKKKFQLPDYNYMGRKNEIENFNALELASEIDERVINFANNYKNDAKTLSEIITKKKKFPRDKFDRLKQAFPCMICSLRDYAEYIPLEKELFDIIIIDEASQVSIAQAFPAIIRSKKMIVLGDRKQFGNVKTSNASKELNTAYFKRVKDALEEEKGTLTSDLEIRADKLNIGNSILDFMESLSNFETTLKKHFRGYPEMISFSSKYFYGNKLQALKIRGKPIEDVLEFVEVEHDGQFDQYKNTNEQEVNKILELILDQLEGEDHRSACVITPHTEQQTLISKIFSEHPKYEDMLRLLKFRSFTFDSCQGEERDIVYYSFVANPSKDRLYGVLPKSMEEQNEEELDRNKKLQRVNVAFSRGKEKLVFVHSKPISDFSAGRDALFHYKSILENKKDLRTSGDVDPNSEAEKKVLEWIKQAPFMSHNPDLETQFEIGKYLSSIDESYTHPKYRVDFLLRFNIDGKQRDIIIEYDGFEFHFENKSEVDAGNWQYYLSEKDIERQHILEAYGYKTIRLNKFNIGDDPIETINDLVEETLNQFEEDGDTLIKKVLEDTAVAQEGLKTGQYKVCSKCDKNKPISDFENPSLDSGLQRLCKSCKPITSRKKKKRKSSSSNSDYKKCPNCNKSYPKSEFEDRTTASGRRRLCGPCKAESVRKQELRSAQWHRMNWK
ncbi:AAA domain-containing protein, partial [Alphaproteobacteria bacterium]|nr:AAA domain-containing protein [Alphaproteobacteria bacterium]